MCIEKAASELIKAVHKHSDIASDKKATKSQLQKADSRVRKAATAYGNLFAARHGTGGPFADIADPRLDEPTVASLKAEWDALLARRTNPTPSDTTPDAASTVTDDGH